MIDSTVEARALVDTNIVVYAYDADDPAKHQVAKDLLRTLSDSGCLVFSVQVLNEFSATMMSRKRVTPLPPGPVVELLRELAATGEVIPLTASMTVLALNAMPRHGLSFWDALIWAAAKENGIPTVYTEDFQHGRDVEGVRILNPFLPGP